MEAHEIVTAVSDFGFSYANEAKIIALAALGTAVVLVGVTAWSKWGYPRWEKKMTERQGEREQLQLMASHAVGSWEYLLKEKAMTPQAMWKLVPKYDNIPGMRGMFRAMVKKYLPQEPAKEVKTTKLSELAL